MLVILHGVLSDNNICDQDNISCSENDYVKIYWDLNGLHQEDPNLIKYIKDNILVPPSVNKPLNIRHINTPIKHMGQVNQVEIAMEILGDKAMKKSKNSKTKQGFFIEAGAADGEIISNTLYFEMRYGWTGLLIEPNPDLLEKLFWRNRKAWIFPHCLSTTEYVEVATLDADIHNRYTT